MESTPEGADAVHRMKPGRKPKAVMSSFQSVPANAKPMVAMEVYEYSAAQAYALRIWSGQSVDLPIAERVQRVVNGLRGQSMSIDVNLPHPDAARFLEKHQ